VRLDYSYKVGISSSVWIATITAGVTCAGVLYYLYVVRGQTRSHPILVDLILGVFVSSFFAYSMGFAALCVSYSILNPLLQLGKLLGPEGSFSSFITNESSTGALGLRISSATMGYAVIIALTRLFLEWPKQERSSDLDELQPVLSDLFMRLTNVSGCVPKLL